MLIMVARYIEMSVLYYWNVRV